LTGQPLPPAECIEGRKWLVEDKDFVSSIRYFRGGKLKLWQWASSFRGVEEPAYLSLDDPIPVVQRAWNLLARISERR